MRTTITIYFDAVNKTAHTLVANVSEGLPGEEDVGKHAIMHSYIGNTSEEQSDMWDAAARYVGAENVRVYNISEYVPTSDMLADIAAHEKRFPNRKFR